MVLILPMLGQQQPCNPPPGKCRVVDDCQVPDNDLDKDGIPDSQDTCPMDSGNDSDNDGLCADKDNCPDVYNPSQTGSDKDGTGDACDPDNAVSFQIIEQDSDHIVIDIRMNTMVQVGTKPECEYDGCRQCNSVDVPTLHESSELSEPMLPWKSTTVLLPFDVDRISVSDANVELSVQQPGIDAESVCRAVYQDEGTPTPDGPDTGRLPWKHFAVSVTMQHKRLKYFKVSFYPVVLDYDTDTEKVANSVELRINYSHSASQASVPPGQYSVIPWRDILNKDGTLWNPASPGAGEHKDVLVLTVDGIHDVKALRGNWPAGSFRRFYPPRCCSTWTCPN